MYASIESMLDEPSGRAGRFATDTLALRARVGFGELRGFAGIVAQRIKSRAHVWCMVTFSTHETFAS
jgi:hypothetical protein